MKMYGHYVLVELTQYWLSERHRDIISALQFKQNEKQRAKKKSDFLSDGLMLMEDCCW